ncbi:hypothetical protein RHGRI_026028 [Rhododendron griersonianum]|uniref:Uncharacterized protein n=1 Tax=Rhododendron griersonianum TaxID=479676 RepID=A0AAV6ISN3_9ERIC|nr:hypothetical protein RHGRI_026028 [Rhododendron griersonianum]
MSSKHPTVRVLGQKSIPSTFLFRSLNHKQASHCKEDVKINAPGKGSRVSLSDFLNKKLHKSSVLPNSDMGKERPFSSPVGSSEVNGSNQGLNGPKKRGETEVKSVVDVVFEQFKCTRKEKEDALRSCDDGEFVSSGTDAMERGRKRKSPLGGGYGEQSAQKNIVVLGEGHPNPIHPTPTSKGKDLSSVSTKKPRHQFNHYANGSGWWNCDMAGVDNEEVGSNEVWEGVGSTTLGGLEWN